MRFSWGVFYLLFWFYRSAFSVVSQLVVARLTSLGDSERYQAAVFTILNSDVNSFSFLSTNRVIGTLLVETIGAVFFLLSDGNQFAINIGFQTIGFVGIVILLRSVEGKTRVWLAVLLLLPSFNVWSSVAGKEAIVVFALGIVCALIIDLYRGRARFRWIYIPAFFLIFLLKDHYLPALVFMIVGTIIAKRVRQRTFLVLVGGTLSLTPLFVFRQKIDELAFDMIPNFLGLGSSREAFWVEQYDVFWKAPGGMFQNFFGPTLAETSLGVLQLFSFVESTVIIGILLVFGLRHLPRLPAYMVFMSGFTIFWVLFTAYPFGIMNPGSAIRYRTGYEMLVFVAIIFLLSRETFVGWRGGATPKEGLSAP